PRFLQGGLGLPELLELDLPLHAGAELHGGATELRHHPAQRAADLGEAPGTEEEEGEDQDQEQLRSTNRSHLGCNPRRGSLAVRPLGCQGTPIPGVLVAPAGTAPYTL